MKIAVVEDEKKLATTLKEGLEGEGYTVDVFYDGKSAEEAISQNPTSYSVVILDLMLPQKDGFEVCESLRAQHVSVPIIVLTARDTLEDKIRVLDSGADDFLTKPFEFQELTARIRAVVRRTQNESAKATMSLGSLSLNLRTQEASRNGTVLALTPTEFSLLVLLVEHADRPVTRDEISMHLWGTEDSALSNIVDVHISNLRKKISDDHAGKSIQTIRGLGYRIEE